MIRLVAAIVPARDEQDTIADCLRSIAAAACEVPPDVAVRTLVVLDRCSDGSAEVVREFPVERLACQVGSAGAARALGAAAVLESCRIPLDEVWIANTDADSTVPPDWLITMVRAADLGADVVLGTVVPEVGLDPEVARAWHSRHPPVENHPHVHGANFGIRAESYHHLGGWQPIPSGEDIALAGRASAAGLAILRTATAPVRTSSRLIGRAPAGFAQYLSALAS